MQNGEDKKFQLLEAERRLLLEKIKHKKRLYGFSVNSPRCHRIMSLLNIKLKSMTPPGVRQNKEILYLKRKQRKMMENEASEVDEYQSENSKR
ncbi:hypothetical protein AgCh_028450 [Apium graveolens]